MKKTNINNFEEKLYYTKLSSGLEIYLVPNKKSKEFLASFTTKYGSSNISFQKDGKLINTPTGIAHFLEHKIFDREDDPFNFYSSIGCDTNAFTSKEVTSFYFTGNSNFKKGFKYLLNFVTDFDITKEKVEKEKQIILEESNMYKDDPYDNLENKIAENIFYNHPDKYKIIGTDEDIFSITKEDLKLCYDSFYRPNNMFIIVTGNFNVNDAFNIIKNIEFNNSNTKIEKVLVKEPDNVVKEFDEINMDIEIPLISVSYKINKNIFNKYGIDKYYIDYYLNMFLTLLFGTCSNFNEENFKNGMFYSINYNKDLVGDHYILSVKAKTNKPIKFIDKIEDHIKSEEFSEEEFERIKKLWIASEVRITDSIRALSYNIMDDIVNYDNFKNTKISDIKSLSYKEFIKIINLIDFSNVSKIVISRKI